MAIKEAVIFIGGFNAQCKDYYLDTFLSPGLLTQIEDIDIKLDPKEVKIPGQTGKRFLCQLENKEKTIDIYEVYWDDLVDHLVNKDIRQKFGRGLDMILYWISRCWKIMGISPTFFIQVSVVLILVLLWYFGVVVLVLSALGTQEYVDLPSFLDSLLKPISNWAADSGLEIWSAISALLVFSPLSINLVIDFTDFLTSYLRDESIRGKPPVRDLLRNRVKQVVDNVNSEGSYEQITMLAHSVGGLIATDFLADYRNQQDQSFRFITWGSPLESASTVTQWMKLEIKKCLDNPNVERWDDFHSSQDWLCSKVPEPAGHSLIKLVSKQVSFKVSLFKQISGYSHFEYFFDARVLRHLVLG